MSNWSLPSSSLSSPYSTISRVSGVESKLLDVVEYQGKEIKIMNTGIFVCDGHNHRSAIQVSRLEALGDKLYGLSHGRLVELKSFQSTFTWSYVKGCPAGIVHTSATRNGTHLWLQTKTMGYLYCESGERIEKLEVDFVRNYGRDVGRWIDSYPERNQSIVYLEGRALEQNHPYAVFDWSGEELEVCPDYEKYKDVRVTSKGSYLISR